MADGLDSGRESFAAIPVWHNTTAFANVDSGKQYVARDSENLQKLLGSLGGENAAAQELCLPQGPETCLLQGPVLCLP